MTISGGSSLSKEEIARMMAEAESHAAEDKQRREEAEIRNTGEALLYQTEKFVADNADKLNEGEAAAKKAELETALADLKTAVGGANFELIKSATEKVSTLSQAMGAAMYAGASAPAGGASEDGVEDAEVIDEDQA
jgi:molecular chaperone DnaK